MTRFVRVQSAAIALIAGLGGAALPATAQDAAPQPGKAMSTEAEAGRAGTSGVDAEAIAKPSEPLAPTTALIAKVRHLISEDASNGIAISDPFRAALVAFYGVADRLPLWFDDQGLTAKAKALLKEFKNADAYGLDPKAYTVRRLETDPATTEDRAAAEIEISAAALTYARHAQAGRLSRKAAGPQLTLTPVSRAPKDILDDLVQQDDAAFYVRSLHPPHPHFAKLRAKLQEARNGANQSAGPKIPDGPVLRSGVSHEHVRLLRQRLGLLKADDEMPRRSAEKFDESVKQAVLAFQKQAGLAEDGVVGSGTRKVLNGQSPERLIAKILVNMERWRWLPDDLEQEAGIYVWANIPELRVRLVKAGKTVFSERAIVGQVHNKTPIFSDRMEWIEMHPTWFVPASIKVADILPSLRRPTSTVMERYNLKVNCGALGSNYKAIDWKTVDISKCHFTQPPGKNSVLGDFKFKFPNKYAVYMHDTHNPSLFRHARRTFSHGCVRVKRPRVMAELLLDHDKGMTSQAIGKILAGPTVLRKEVLNKPVPVHMTYFTATLDDEGRLKLHPDYYGHDRRISLALTGKAFADPQSGKARSKPRQRKRVAKKNKNWADTILQSN